MSQGAIEIMFSKLAGKAEYPGNEAESLLLLSNIWGARELFMRRARWHAAENLIYDIYVIVTTVYYYIISSDEYFHFVFELATFVIS
jgi:hypothetical protein